MADILFFRVSFHMHQRLSKGQDLSVILSNGAHTPPGAGECIWPTMGLELSNKRNLLVYVHLGFAKGRWLPIFKREGERTLEGI